jgi:uncharacterized protein YfaS (alpha-2-macroglobulin family)
MTLPAKYQPGDVVKILFTIVQADGLTPFDPSSVRFHTINPAGTKTTKTFGTDSEVTKLSTGVYQFLLAIPYTAAAVGTWTYDAQGLDAGSNSLLVESDDFEVVYLRTI